MREPIIPLADIPKTPNAQPNNLTDNSSHVIAEEPETAPFMSIQPHPPPLRSREKSKAAA